MKRSLIISLLAALAISSAAVGIARADEASHYNVAIWNPITNAYPVTGTMDLSFHPGGVVRGYYHPAGLPSFIPITGGRTGNRIWLTIGLYGSWQLNGRFHDGKITGSAIDEHPSLDNNVGKFGVPVALVGAAPIYSFVATPH